MYSLPCPSPLWGCPWCKHPAEMEESHGKQDLCQDGQDRLGHRLKREDPSIASHAEAGRDKDEAISAEILSGSEAFLTALRAPEEISGVSTARFSAPKLQVHISWSHLFRISLKGSLKNT